MRLNQFITSLWAQGGPYVGDNKPHGRVTVQLPWSDLEGDHKYDFLRTTYDAGVGTYAHRGIPLRWYQDLANDQVELEIPNVKQIHTTRSVDSDAGTFEIDIYNQQMFDNDAIPISASELGQPGFYSVGRGVSLDAQARWGQETNDWENLLVPNALIRTYQGYGGHGKTIEQAVADDNIMLTGLWLADHVEIHTDGTIKITGRDMAKLLIDQQLYIPLIPKEDYPLTYYRFIYFNQPVHAQAITATTNLGSITAGTKNCVYETSEVDAWYESLYGHDMLLHGHHPSDAFDGNPDTYYMSVGNSRPDAAFADAWLQATCGEGMNAVYVNPWAGNYTMYVSVMEHGIWQGTDTIPYDYSELVGTQPYWVDTGANIPYVASFGVPWETAQEYILPRVYAADRVRITLRDLTYTDFGPWQYRGGIREFSIRGSVGGPLSMGDINTIIEPIFISADAHPSNGYVTLTQFSQIDALGEARDEQFHGFFIDNSPALAIRMSRTGDGYYMLHQNGWVYTFGDAAYFGDLHDTFDVTVQPSKQANDIALTADGLGYWILQSDGTITGFGSVAADLFHCALPADRSFCISLESHDDKLWALDTSGRVYTFRGAVNYGNFSPYLPANPPFATIEAVSLRTTSTGLGYWIATNIGHVQHFGDAPDIGQMDPLLTLDGNWRDGIWEIITVSDSNNGIMLLKGDGNVYEIGVLPDGDYYAGPASGVDEQRKDGNYKDWTDIIRDLALWAGFLLYDPDLATNAMPDVFGNLESTGSYSPTDLPTDMFDKKPVIDAMHAIKEAVGYLIWIDDEGGFRFESPNWWAPGNFDEVGDHTNQMLQLDEAVTLIDYTATFTDDVLRSLIIISSEDPDQGTGATITTRLIPSSKRQLRGLVKPAMWVNGYFTKPEEQKIMAELIALHTWFQTRVGQVTCVANPCLQINDQVRIWERQAAESYVHYVRGIDTTMDLDAGSYTMTVTTNWLGDETSWAIQDAGTFTSSVDPDDPRTTWVVSEALADALRARFGSKAANLFGAPVGPVLTALAPGSQDGTGAGPT